MLLELLSGSGSSPRLVQVPRSGDPFIVMEFVPARHQFESDADYLPAAFALGRLHGNIASYKFRSGLIHRLRSRNLSAILGVCTNKDAAFYELALKVFGAYHVPFSIGDIKQEHWRSDTGRCLLADFETFSWGSLEYHDVACLLQQSSIELYDLSAGFIDDVLNLYAAGRLSCQDHRFDRRRFSEFIKRCIEESYSRKKIEGNWVATNSDPEI